MAAFSAARSAEILRSNQKDEQYLFWLRREIAEIVQNVIGIGRWLKWRREIDILSDFLYFAATTLSGFQSLGEEYVNIVQVDNRHRFIPSFLKRIVSVALEVSSPFLLRILLLHLEQSLQNAPSSTEQLHLRNQLLKYLPTLKWIISFIQRFHLSLFYFNGTFYHISKRMAGIRYVLVRNWLGNKTSQRVYRLLGVLSMTQLLIGGVMQGYSFYYQKMLSSSDCSSSTTIVANVDDSAEVPAREKCCLCLEKRRFSTATPCGHLFCWFCIAEWVETKKMCPLCREEFLPSRLVLLQNYS